MKTFFKNFLIGFLTVCIIFLIFVSSAYIIFAKGYYSNNIEIIQKPDINIEETINLELPMINEEDVIKDVQPEINKYEKEEVIEEKISDDIYIPTEEDFDTIKVSSTNKNKDKNEKQEENSAIYKEEKKNEEIVNILLTGMDARSYDTRSRSDAIILLSYNKTTKNIKMVSFMRDSWVYLVDKGWSRINAATAYGGTGLLINSINYNFDLDIQNYVEIKFNDFKKVIDIIDGIDVQLSQAEIDYINNKLHVEDNDFNNDITQSPGIVHLNGAQALWHCRNRTIGNSDFTRTERQREVLEIIINKALRQDLNVVINLLYEMQNYVNTNIPISTIIDMATSLLTNGNIKIETTRIPFDGMYQYANKNGASVLELDMDKNKEALWNFLEK